MRIHVIAGTLALVLAAAGCAAPQPAAAPVAAAPAASAVVAQADPAAPQIVCHQEIPIGSQVMRRVCERKRTDAETAAAQDFLRDAMRSQDVKANTARGGQ
jgi:hypothetical protein